jgi:hypothetical protein
VCSPTLALRINFATGTPALACYSTPIACSILKGFFRIQNPLSSQAKLGDSLGSRITSRSELRYTNSPLMPKMIELASASIKQGPNLVEQQYRKIFSYY